MFHSLPDKISGAIFILISAFLYATLAINVKYAYLAGLTPDTALLLRYFSAFLILFIYLRLFKKQPVLNLSPMVIIQGIVLITGGIAFFYSLSYLPAGIAAVILFSHPALVAVSTLVVFKEKFSPRLFLGVFLAIAGILLISGLTDSFMDISIKGISWAVLASICYTVYSLISQVSVNKVPPFTLTSTFSLVGVILIAITFHDFSFFYSLNWLQFIIGLSLALLNTILSVGFFLKGVQKIGASRASLLSITEPVFTLLIAFVLLNEVLAFWEVIGSVMVLLSSCLAVSTPKKEPIADKIDVT